MELLPLVKAIHLVCASLSITLFTIRGVWHLRASERLKLAWVRVAPHVVDALLLLSGIVMVLWTGQYPGAVPWLTVKLVAVVVYIGLGMLAFRFAPSRTSRLLAWLGALAVFAYIVWVAVNRQWIP